MVDSIYDGFAGASATPLPPLPPETLFEKAQSVLAWPIVYEPLIVFALLGFTSALLRYSKFRRMRGVILLSATIYLGFYRAGSTGMISSFQDGILWILKQSGSWIFVVWFLTLVLATYLFGKVWCGWLCHMGALQEFLFRTTKKKRFTGKCAQQVLKIIQVCSFIALVVQLCATRTNEYKHYDPFAVAFNLTSPNLSGYVLLAALLLTSLFIERPFCRALCPMGLLLGWVSLIPGARKVVKQDQCAHCAKCVRTCPNNALIKDCGKVILHLQECIACGECVAACPQNGLQFKRIQKRKYGLL